MSKFYSESLLIIFTELLIHWYIHPQNGWNRQKLWWNFKTCTDSAHGQWLTFRLRTEGKTLCRLEPGHHPQDYRSGCSDPREATEQELHESIRRQYPREKLDDQRRYSIPKSYWISKSEWSGHLNSLPQEY